MLILLSAVFTMIRQEMKEYKEYEALREGLQNLRPLETEEWLEKDSILKHKIDSMMTLLDLK